MGPPEACKWNRSAEDPLTPGFSRASEIILFKGKTWRNAAPAISSAIEMYNCAGLGWQSACGILSGYIPVPRQKHFKENSRI